MQQTIAVAGHGAPRRSGPSHARALSITEVAILVSIVATLAVAAFAVRSPLPTDMATFEYRVETGDTLWDLAESHPVPGLSTEQTVSLIAEANGLDDTSILSAGASIHLPSQSSTDGNVALR